MSWGIERQINDVPLVRGFVLFRIAVVARGVMFAGICWEVQGRESRVTECIICWFAMFSYHDVLIDLMEVES